MRFFFNFLFITKSKHCTHNAVSKAYYNFSIYVWHIVQVAGYLIVCINNWYSIISALKIVLLKYVIKK